MTCWALAAAHKMRPCLPWFTRLAFSDLSVLHDHLCPSFFTFSSASLSFLRPFLPSDKLSGCREDLKPTGLMRKSPSLESVIKTPTSFSSRASSFSCNRGNSKLRWEYPQGVVWWWTDKSFRHHLKYSIIYRSFSCDWYYVAEMQHYGWFWLKYVKGLIWGCFL